MPWPVSTKSMILNKNGAAPMATAKNKVFTELWYDLDYNMITIIVI